MGDIRETIEERPASRRSFLRKIGVLAAAGLGVGLLPVDRALAAGARCCVDTSGFCGGTPPPGEVWYKCTDGCSGTSCCWHWPSGPCKNVPCFC